MLGLFFGIEGKPFWIIEIFLIEVFREPVVSVFADAKGFVEPTDFVAVLLRRLW